MDTDEIVELHNVDEFNTAILKDKWVIVCFYQPICELCDSIMPLYHSKSSNRSIEFYKYDVTDATIPDGVFSHSVAVPIFVAYKNGIEKSRVVGADENKFKSLITKIERKIEHASDIIQLYNKRQFHKINGNFIVYFYSETCPHCRMVDLEYNKQSRNYLNFDFYKYDVTNEGELPEKDIVVGTPTIIFYHDTLKYNIIVDNDIPEFLETLKRFNISINDV